LSIMSNTITLSDLITDAESDTLMVFVKSGRANSTVHNLIMKWLDGKPLVMKRFEKNGVIKAYGAYLLEYQLRLK